jgi:hypothetical protein
MPIRQDSFPQAFPRVIFIRRPNRPGRIFAGQNISRRPFSSLGFAASFALPMPAYASSAACRTLYATPRPIAARLLTAANTATALARPAIDAEPLTATR